MSAADWRSKSSSDRPFLLYPKTEDVQYYGTCPRAQKASARVRGSWDSVLKFEEARFETHHLRFKIYAEVILCDWWLLMPCSVRPVILS